MPTSKAFDNVYKLRRQIFVEEPTFGAKGDGVTNDLTAIASAIAALAPGGDLYFDPAKTYLVETPSGSGIVIPKPMAVHFNGARIKHVGASGSQNTAIEVKSTLGTAETWVEAIGAGTSTLNIVTSIAVGTIVLVELGESPYDSTIAHFHAICRVLTNTGSAITIDEVTPYAINDTGHAITPLSSVAQNVRLHGVNIDQVGPHGSNPDIALALTMARNVYIDTYQYYDVGVAISCRKGTSGVKIGSMEGNVKQHGALTTHGRAFTTWGSRNIDIDLVRSHSTLDAAMFFFEGFSRNIRFGLVEASIDTPAEVTTGLFRPTGEASRIRVGKVNIASTNGIRLQTVTQDSEIEFGEVWLNTSLIKAVQLNDIVEKLHYNGTTYQRPRSVRRTIPIVGSVAGLNVDILSGHIRKLLIYVDSLTDVTSVFLRNSNGDLLNILSQLSAGAWAEISGSGVYQWNSDGASPAVTNLNYPDKQLRFNTGSTCNSLFKVYAEYFPEGSDAGEGTEVLQGSITWNPASLADGAGETSSGITVTGAAVGDTVLVYPPYDLQDCVVYGYVQATDTVEIRLQNESTNTVNLASGVWKVRVIKASLWPAD